MVVQAKNYRYYDMILGLFVAVLLISNIVSVKAIVIALPWLKWSLSFDGGTILFPISYIFADILTEVYGYERSRRAIWCGFSGMALMALTIFLVGIIPPDPLWNGQEAYQGLLMTAPRIVLASIVAYFCGEFVNSYVLSRMKVIMQGKHLWARAITSTLFGELLDSAIFVYLAFWGVWDQRLLFTVFISNYIFKVAYEVLVLPLTYRAVNWLKKCEAEDHYDRDDVNYNPFLFR